jgi:hypothetical protein
MTAAALPCVGHCTFPLFRMNISEPSSPSGEESPVYLKRCLTGVPRDVSVAKVLVEFKTKIGDVETRLNTTAGSSQGILTTRWLAA